MLLKERVMDKEEEQRTPSQKPILRKDSNGVDQKAGDYYFISHPSISQICFSAAFKYKIKGIIRGMGMGMGMDRRQRYEELVS